jgi:NADH:ubiquinone oxidoreductase subunit F (NADH-binding)
MTDLLATPAAWPRILSDRWSSPPADLAAARKAGAFDALGRVVRELGPMGTMALLDEAGLRGRGGAGYPAAAKWRATAEADGDAVVVANGYGADPGSATDRTLLERDPWAVVEGTIIAAFAIGASEAIIAVRSDAPAVVDTVRRAVEAAVDAGYAGEDAAGTGRAIALTVRPVGGSYMIGEETVLLRTLASRRAQPEQRPPHPASRGLDDRPTLVNNVATLAAVPWIVREGAPAFAAIGQPEAPGTVLVHVRGSGDDGVVEAPTGTSLAVLAGLLPAAAAARAYLVGGPTGGILPASAADTGYAFDELRAAGAHVGSGSIVAIDDRACIVDVVRLLSRFAADVACGKTIPCRIGLRRLSEIVDRAAAGSPRAGDEQLAGDLADDVVGSGLCDHERLATLALSGAMRHFASEVRAHVVDGTCPAGVCTPAMATIGSAS